MANRRSHTFRAFYNRNYALYFSGQSVSQIGTWMQRTAVSWVVYTLTHSAFMLGLTVFASQFPSFLFSLAGGVVSDRYDRYKIMLITQGASMVQAILMAILFLTNHYAVWQVLVLSVMLGVINAFDVPSRQPMVHDMISNASDLPNALAFNSSMNHFARLVGPAISGIVLQHLGAAVCFLMNAVSFVFVLTSLLLMKLPAHVPKPGGKKIMAELADGFRYIRHTRAIGMVLLMLTLASLLVLPYNTLLPVYAKVIFKGDAATYGYINSFIGLGAVAGTLFLASLKQGSDLKFVLLLSTVIFGICLMLFAFTAYFPLAMIFATVCGFGTMSQTAICNTILQVNSEAHMRGRVISFLAMAVFGMMPLGSLLVGGVSEAIGAQATVFCQGIVAILIAAIFSKFLRADRMSEKERKALEATEEAIIEEL